MSSDPTLRLSLHMELQDALQDFEAASGPASQGREEELHLHIISIATILQCNQRLYHHQTVGGDVLPFLNSLQQTLLLPALRTESKRAMTNSLSLACREHKALPLQVKISAGFSLINPRTHHPDTDDPNADVFPCVAHRGRLITLELPRAKDDAKESKIERLIHTIILRFNYPNSGLLPLEGVHQDVNGDFHRTYLISPYYQHGSIQSHINRTGVNRLHLLKNLLKALDFLSTNNIVHGRIRISQVVVDDDGQARLSGLGHEVPAFPSRESYPLMAGCLTLGEYLCMAPELLRAHRDGVDALPTAASDLYSFALVAYQLFTGAAPFPEARAKRYAVIGIRRLFEGVIDNNERPSKPSSHSMAYTHNGMTDDIWEMLEDCWAPDPNKRPTARDILRRPFMVLADLEFYGGHES